MNDAIRTVEAQWIEHANHPNDLGAEAARTMAREHIAVLRAVTEPAERHLVAVNMDGIATRHDNYRAEIGQDPDIAAEVLAAGIKARADRDKEYAAGAAHMGQLDAAQAATAPDAQSREMLGSMAKRGIEDDWIELLDVPTGSLQAIHAEELAVRHAGAMATINDPTARYLSASKMNDIAEKHPHYKAEVVQLSQELADEMAAAGKASAVQDVKWTDIPATPGLSERSREGWVSISPEDALFLEASKGIHAALRQAQLDRDAAIEAMPGAHDGVWEAERLVAVQPIDAQQSFERARAQRAEADAQLAREQDAAVFIKAAEAVRLAQVGPLTAEQTFEAARAEREAVVTSDTKLLHSISGNAGVLLSAPDGVAEAKEFVAGDLEALRQIRTAELRTRALWVMANMTAAQSEYRLELDRVAPDIAREAAAAGKVERRREVQEAIDQESREQVAEQRARDRVDAGKAMGLNTIERGDSWGGDPVQQDAWEATKAVASTGHATSRPRLSEVLQTHVPPEVQRAYHRDGKKFYLPKNKNHVAFEDHGHKLETSMTSSGITLSMIQIAQARGWREIKVRGSNEFRREAWREAALRGIAVQGYTPNETDLADLARRQPKAVVLEKEPAPKGPPPRTGDVLVAHGAAPYQHDANNPDSYFVTVENPQGKQRTTWGVNLGKAIAKSGVKVGDPITLTKNGQKQVEVETVDKDAAGNVVGTRKIGAIRNEWEIKTHALNTLPPEQAVKAHPELAGAIAVAAAIDKRAAADGYTPAQRAIIAARVSRNITNTIERGSMPVVQLREASEVRREVQQEQSL